MPQKVESLIGKNMKMTPNLTNKKPVGAGLRAGKLNFADLKKKKTAEASQSL